MCVKTDKGGEDEPSGKQSTNIEILEQLSRTGKRDERKKEA